MSVYIYLPNHAEDINLVQTDHNTSEFRWKYEQ